MLRRTRTRSTQHDPAPPTRRRRVDANGRSVAVGGLEGGPSLAGPPSPATCKIATFNVQSARGGNLEALARALEWMHVDLCLVTETKLADSRHSKSLGLQCLGVSGVEPLSRRCCLDVERQL